MNDYVHRAKERFIGMRDRSVTYARYREAFWAEVTGIMCVLDPLFDYHSFVARHLPRDPGDSEIDPVWCAQVINDLLSLPLFVEPT